MDVVIERRAAAPRALHRYTLLLCLLAALAGLSARAGAAAPSVGAVVSNDSGSGIGRYQKLDLSFPVTTQAANLQLPYDPVAPSYAANLTPVEDARRGVSVDCLLLPPGQTDWSQARVQPAFYYEGYDRTAREASYAGEGFENLMPDGQDGWRVRFAPDTVGTWQYQIRVTDAGGTTASPVGTFTCVASPSRGFVRVSPTDGRYFQFDDGTPANLIGWNVYDKGYDGFTAEMNALKTAGVATLGRTWIASRSGMEVIGGFADSSGGRYWGFGSGTSVMPGDAHSGRYSVRINAGSNLNTYAYLKPNTPYTLTAWIKPVGVTGAAWSDPDGSSGTGPALRIGFNQSDNGYRGGGWGDVQDLAALPAGQWTRVTQAITAGDPFSGRNYAEGIGFNPHMGGGYVLVDDVKVTGPDGRDVLEVGDFERHVQYNQRQSWLLDYCVDQAQAAGQYLRLNCLEKNDAAFYFLGTDGANVAANDNNTFGATTDPKADIPARRFQRYYARYLTARWGYSTAVAQFEYLNEGDVYNGNHYAGAQAFAAALHAAGAQGRRPCGTSFYWNSAGYSYMYDLYEGSFGGYTFPDLDYADIHSYNGAGGAIPYNDIRSIGGGWQRVPDGGPNGLGCLRIDAPTSQGNMGLPMIRVQGKGTWTISYKARTSGGVQINRGGNGGDFAFQVDGAWKSAAMPAHPASGDFDWTKFTGTFTLSDDAKHTVGPGGVARLGVDGGGFTAGRIEVSDIRVTAPDGTPCVRYAFNEPTEDVDTASLAEYSGLMYTGYGGPGIGKPLSFGEMGISNPNNLPNFDMNSDAQGVFAREAFWAQTNASGAIVLWWYDLCKPAVQKGFMRFGAAYQRFMAGIPVANGRYRNVDAAVSTPALVVIGQKDAGAGKAHFYVYNRQYNWYNATNNPGAITPASGTITVAGLPDGAYTVQTWDTAAGTVSGSQTLTSSGGSLAVPVSALTGDTAFKVFPATAPLLAVTLTPDKAVAKPGEVVTYTLAYVNKGTGDAQNVQLPWTLPAQTQFVSASGGGVYNAARNEVDWSLGTVAAGAGGSVTLTVRVN